MTRSGPVDTMPEQLDATGRNFAVRRMLGDELETVTRTRLRVPKLNLGEDLRLLRAGVLDRASFKMGYDLLRDPTEMVFTRLIRKDEVVNPALIVRDPRFFTEPVQVGKADFADRAFGLRGRIYTAIRRQHNLRTTFGRDLWQRAVMFGDVAAVGYSAQIQSSATSTGSTSLTNTGAAFPTKVTDMVTSGTTTITSATAAFTQMDVGRIIPNGSSTNIPNNTYISSVTNATTAVLSNAATGSGSGGTLIISRYQGKTIWLSSGGGKRGTIVSNTDQILNIDQWTDVTSSTGAVGSNPGPTVAYIIGINGAPSLWIGLCATGGSGNPPTGGHAPAAGDILRVADGLFGDGSAAGAASEQTASGLARVYVAPTFPAAGQIQLSQLFTYTGSSVVTLDVAILANAKAVQGAIMLLETQLNASAAVSANGDTVTPTWTINL